MRRATGHLSGIAIKIQNWKNSCNNHNARFAWFFAPSQSDFKVSCFKSLSKKDPVMEDKGLTKASAMVLVLAIVVCNEQRVQQRGQRDNFRPTSIDTQVPQLHTLSNTRPRQIVTGKVIHRASAELPIIQNPNTQVHTCEWRS